ncbi:MAG: hypothetical protein GY765_02105 [bacterium]|nr:hypothetical protein [bacterium]
MKRIFSMLTFFVIIFVFLGITTLSLQSKDKFEIKADGTVTAGKYTFDNMSDYFHSDYFKKNKKRCGFKHVATDREYASASDCTTSLTVIQDEYDSSVTLTIPMVFHIIYKTDGTGNISDQRINDQVTVMNEDYGAIAGSLGANGYNTKIQFTLAGITRTENDSWHNDNDELTYKGALGWDQNTYLNVYVNSASGNLGYAYLPQDYAGDTRDGVVLLYSSCGGRDTPDADPYDQGRTLVHEVGHYLGLLHTFAGYGCYDGYAAGDLIADTNSENTDHYACIQTYTCGTDDPIHNYMDYSDDTCMYLFTQEQANRMVCCIMNYRPNIYSTTNEPGITVTSPNGGNSWTIGTSKTITWTSNGTVGNVKIEYSTNNGSSWNTVVSSTTNDGSYYWTVPNAASTTCLAKVSEASDGDPTDTSNAVFTITSEASGTPTIVLSRSMYYYTAAGSNHTGAQSLWLGNSGSGTLSWAATTDSSWLSCSPASGSGKAEIMVSVDPTGLSAGTYTGTMSIADTGATNSPQTTSVSLTVKAANQDQAPFGLLATPVSGTTASSSIPVTGWVLDDVEVSKVELYRGTGTLQYIGDAIMVDGARSDIAANFPQYPMNYQAGWGYMLLSHFLPNGGNGSYTITAVATDNAGNSTVLGTTTFTADNDGAVKPFGAIDTPSPGGIASSSSFRHAGWTLTPLPNTVPTDGSTINLYIDGVYKGHPTYNVYRPDIASLFPGYNNTGGAHAYMDIDTTTYQNGLHTIYWTVADDAGNADGIGSRFFKVANTGSSKTPAKTDSRNASINTKSIARFPLNPAPVGFIKGFAPNAQIEPGNPGPKGTVEINLKEMERIELHLGSATHGYIQSGESLYPLPIGSTLDRDTGIFYWYPGPGFLGDYQLVFIDNAGSQKRITIKIGPKFGVKK